MDARFVVAYDVLFSVDFFLKADESVFGNIRRQLANCEQQSVVCKCSKTIRL
jgi:hypothetical protein